MLVTAETRPGSPGQPNEDWLAVTPDLVIVLDGATVRTDTGCVHGVAWYVNQLGVALIEKAQDHAVDLRTALANAIGTVAYYHRRCDLRHPGTPSAAVAVMRQATSSVEYLVLGDITIVLDNYGDESLVTITDDRISQTAIAERVAADRALIGTSDKAAALVTMKHGELAHRNRPGGYWIAAADKAAAYHAVTGDVSVDQLRRFAVLTDGAARFTTTFHLGGWRGALDMMDRGQTASLIDCVRACEQADPTGHQYPRNKSSDDATAVFGMFRRSEVTLTAGAGAQQPVAVFWDSADSGLGVVS